MSSLRVSPFPFSIALILLLLTIIGCFGRRKLPIGHVSGHGKVGGEKEKWKPAYENVELIKQMKKEKNTPNIFYFPQDGTCGVWDSDKTKLTYVKPLLNYTSLKDIKCLHEFHRVAFEPACGDSSFARVKLCAMVHFFDNKLPEDSDVLNGNEIDLALAIIDGCAVCNKNGNGPVEMQLSLGLSWPKGSFFTTCAEEEKEVGGVENVQFTVNNYGERTVNQFKAAITDQTQGASFIVPGVFYQRICETITGEDDVLTSYDNVWLKVTHNCGGEGGTFTVKLPKLVAREHQYHIAEMRGLLLNLDNSDWFQMDMDRAKFGESKQLKWGNKLGQDVPNSVE